MKKLFALLFILLIIASSIVPVSLKSQGEDTIHVIDHIAFLIAAVCSIITVVVAILLYDKYGVGSKIVDKNLQLVLQAIEVLKKTNAFAKCENDNGSYILRLNFWTTEISQLDMMKRYLDDPVYFRISYAYAFEKLFQLCQDPLLPKSISEKIKNLQLYLLPDSNQNINDSRYAVISAHYEGVQDLDDSVVGKFNGHDMTLREYILKYEAVKTAIKQWLKEHQVDESCLNF